jgi:hypothetical protein
MSGKEAVDVFSKGCLINLRSSVWGGKIKIPSDLVSRDSGADPSFIAAHKFLVEKSSLKAIEHARGMARSWLVTKSIPFPVKGLIFVPRDMISRVDNTLQDYQSRFYEMTNEFIERYDELKESAKENLGDLYNPDDYPSDIANKFEFAWDFFILDAPNHLITISPALYEREVHKFKSNMAGFEVLARKTQREALKTMVSNIVERLSGENEKGKFKVFRDTLLSNIREFVYDFPSMNITGDLDLEVQAVEVGRILGDTTPAELRTDESVRDNILTSMELITLDLNTLK